MADSCVRRRLTTGDRVRPTAIQHSRQVTAITPFCHEVTAVRVKSPSGPPPGPSGLLQGLPSVLGRAEGARVKPPLTRADPIAGWHEKPHDDAGWVRGLGIYHRVRVHSRAGE